MWRKGIAAAALIGTWAVIPGCSPTAEEAVRSFGPTLCARQQECLPGIYALAYPKDAEAGDGTTTQCVNEMVHRLGDDKNRRSACNDDELAACKSDIEKLSCDALTSASLGTTSSLPSSCQDC